MQLFRTKYFSVLLLICLIYFSHLQGQAPNNYTPTIIPPSPNASTLLKFSDVPVSPYTGASDISVPIYTIQARGLSVPISLDYHTGGIRVREESGWVGLGWALNAGGMVSRTIMDMDDFGGSPSNYFVPSIPQLPGDLTATHPFYPGDYLGTNIYDFFCSYLVNTTSGAEDLSSLFSNGHGFDLEPDVYTYSFLGRSGKFMITRAGKVVLQKQDNVRIQFEANGNSFTITDESGNRYLFYDKEYTQSAIGTPPPAVSTWALSKIITQLNDTVSFTYLANGYSFVQGDLTQTFNALCSTAGFFENQATATMYLNQTLSTIDFTNGQVQFSFDAARRDIQNARKLNNVKIYSKNAAGTLSFIKESDLFYSYFNSSHTGSDSLEFTRLKLDSVKELSGTLLLPPYSFTYNGQTDQLPGKHAKSFDHWGFYNNSSPNSSLIPTQNVYFNPPGYVFPPLYVSYSGADREPNSMYIPYASLQQVKYPTGGKTVFEYEPNDYDDHNSKTGPVDYPDQRVVTVSKANSITAHGKTTGTINFTHINPLLPNGINATNATMTVGFVYTTNGSYTYVPSSDKIYVTLDGPGISTKIDGGNAGTGPGQVQCGGPACGATISLTISSFNAYTWTAYIDPSVDASFSLIRITFTWQEGQTDYQADIFQNMISLASGLRIKSITDFKDATTPSKKRMYNYSYYQDKLLNGTPQKYSFGRLMSFPSYIRNVLVPYPAPQSGMCYGLSITSSSNTSLTSVIQGNIVGYDRVEEYNVDPVTNADIGKTIYSYYNCSDSTTSYSGFKFPGILNMGNSLNGTLLSKLEYANNSGIYSKVAETYNFYHTANRVVYFTPRSDFNLRTGGGGAGTTICPGGGVSLEVTACFYPSIKSEKILLDSTYDIIYDQFDTTKFIITKKYFYYDNPAHYQLTRSASTDSKGNILISQLKYPQDYIPNGLTKTNNTILDSLIGRNIIAGVIEKRDSLYYGGLAGGGKVTGAQLSKYKFLTGGSLGMDKQYRLDQLGPIGDFQPFAISANTTSQDSRYRQMISLDSYDNTNNIAQYTATDQTPVSILWDYKNLYPIAQVKNATLSDIAFTSFEADGNGGWTVSSATRDAVNFITGTKSYNLSSGSISKPGLVTGKIYLVTYWSKNGSYAISGGTVTTKTGRTVNGWTYYEQTVTTSSTTITLTGAGNIDELRLYPNSAQMTSFTYSPLVGTSTTGDLNSNITFYKYDNLGRLVTVMDQDGNILKTIKYHYSTVAIP